MVMASVAPQAWLATPAAGSGWRRSARAAAGSRYLAGRVRPGSVTGRVGRSAGCPAGVELDAAAGDRTAA